MAEKPEPRIEFSEEVTAAAAADPDLAAVLRKFCAAVRQAMHAVETGQHPSFDVAMKAITGHRPERVDLDDLDDDEVA